MVEVRKTIEGKRVLIRKLRIEDSDPIFLLVNDPEVVRWTTRIPHPYPEDAAAEFICNCQGQWQKGEAFVFAQILMQSGEFLGVIGLSNVARTHGCAELGFWTGRPYWNNGFATEAVSLVLRFAFDDLGLHRVYASTFEKNAGSRKVLEKNRFSLEGIMREAVVRYDQRHNFLNYGILSREFPHK